MNEQTLSAAVLALSGTTDDDEEEEYEPADEPSGDQREDSEDRLDEALKETFPASDPISP